MLPSGEMSVRHSCAAALVIAVLASISGCGGERGTAGASAAPSGVPRFEYDASWPKLPLPNQWVFGEVGGVGVDNRNHVWVIQRPWTVIDRELAAVDGTAECCRPAPPVVEFDEAGNVVQAWPMLH